MATVYANLIKGDKTGPETDYRDALPINMSAVDRPMFGAAGYMLQQPGLTQYGLGFGIDRRGIWNEKHNEHYRVSGNKFVKVDSGGSATELGAIPGLDTASLPYSFNTQGIVANGQFWLYDDTNGFIEVTDPDLGNPVDAVWINGKYVFTDLGFLYHTEISDETAINPLAFATSEFSPDPTFAVAKTTDNKLIAFNRYSTEFFEDIATELFAFTRIKNLAIKIGVVGTHCKAEIADNWYIMGSRKDESVSVHVLTGASAKNIGTREIDKTIAKYTEDQLKVSVLESRVVDNIPYLIIHLPGEVLLYNFKIAAVAGTAQAWSILTTDVGKGTPWRGKFGIFEPRLGKWVYGDKRSGLLGILDNDASTQYGELSEWELNTPYMYFDSVSIDELEIETIPGHTVFDDATVFVSLTYDGVTHGFEYVQAYGDPSAFTTRFILYQLGHVDQWVSIKLRGASRSRMAFSRVKMEAG